MGGRGVGRISELPPQRGVGEVKWVIEALVLLVWYRVVETPTDCSLVTGPASLVKWAADLSVVL